jgi:aspartyl-tRNA(Asn)/glutamyl-tRNA(Gln) amidotransferase subunit A
MTVSEIGRLLRARKISCLELIEQTLNDIKERDAFHCFITLTEDQARARAKELDEELASGRDRGPFHGVPIAFKDLFCTRGVRTTAGSLIFRDFVPDYDATVVERLTAAGAVSVGKTNLHELAFGITSRNPHFGAVLNPVDTKRLAGGSSGGSAAAIAAGFLPLALGTDTGGSVRIPASFCGITGLKPTYGRVSRHGVLPLAYSLDHVGPLGSTAEDCALAMNVIAGPDFRDATSVQITPPDFNLPPLANVKDFRVGVPENFFLDRVDQEVAGAVRASASKLQQLGAHIREVRVPDIEEANLAARVVQLAEVAAVYVNSRDLSQFGDDVRALIEQGRMLAAHEYVNAQRVRTLFRRELDAIWRDVDVLVCPTTPTTAPPADQTTIEINGTRENTRMASTRLVRSINFFGEPALSMPCGTDKNGLPIGLQLIGPAFSEPRLLQIGKTLEQALR